MKRNSVIVILILLLIVFTPSLAQEDDAQVVIMQVEADQPITFVGVDAQGNISDLGALPPEFYLAFSPNTGSTWLISSPGNIVLSPDQRYIALSAEQRFETTLFIYQITGEQVWSAPVNNPVSASWSPDSHGFVFWQSADEEDDSEEGLFYVNVDSPALTLLSTPAEVAYAQRFVWLDNETITFSAYLVGSGYENLLSITLDGQTTILFRTNDWLPTEFVDTICEREWSDNNQVIYFSVGCVLYEATVLQQAYATTLDGDVSLLLTPPDAMRQPVLQANFLIRGIETHGNSTYFVIVENLRTLNEIDVTETFSWRILRLRNGEWTEIYQESPDNSIDIESPTISPDGHYLTVGRYDFRSSDGVVSTLVVIDLETGRIIREIDGAGRYGWTVIWLNHYTFVYTTLLLTESGRRTLLVDLSRFGEQDLSDQLGEFIWLFR